jgi:hypothetical protein
MDTTISPLDSDTNNDFNSDCRGREIYWERRGTSPSAIRAISIHLDVAAGYQWDLLVPDSLYCQMATEPSEKGQSCQRDRYENKVLMAASKFAFLDQISRYGILLLKREFRK